MAGTSVAERLTEPISALTGDELPLRVRAWDGSETGPTDTPVGVVRSRRALRHLLWKPNELGVARAYVSGDLDVEGDLEEGFRRLRQFGRSHGQGIRISLGERVRAVATIARPSSVASSGCSAPADAS